MHNEPCSGRTKVDDLRAVTERPALVVRYDMDTTTWMQQNVMRGSTLDSTHRLSTFQEQPPVLTS
jgi:hypothetical protein